jgi:hypothetical protein
MNIHTVAPHLRNQRRFHYKPRRIRESEEEKQRRIAAILASDPMPALEDVPIGQPIALRELAKGEEGR